jgi:hypothetical protein
MRTFYKVTLAALTTILVVGMAAAGALASRAINFEPTGRVTMSGTLQLADGSGSINIQCALTLTWEVPSQVSKVLGNSAGSITGDRVNEAGCSGGRITPLGETLPWPVTYVSFAGTLPNISSVRLTIRGLAFQAVTAFATCLFAGNLEITTNGTPVSSVSFDESRALPLIRGTAFCPSSERLSARLPLEHQVRLTLI